MGKDTKSVKEFQSIIDHFSGALESNDVRNIAKFVTDDWTIVRPQSGPISGEIIFSLISSGVLKHSTMVKEVTGVELNGNAAIVTSRSRNSGTWRGKPIEIDEWMTEIFVRTDDGWRCAITRAVPATLIDAAE